MLLITIITMELIIIINSQEKKEKIQKNLSKNIHDLIGNNILKSVILVNGGTENSEICSILEDLYALNLMLDNGVNKDEISAIYPVLSKYNDTKSPNIQTFLAGIYRKTKIPDGFGPLVKMLIQDSINPPNAEFDPTEEIGGAILDYLA